jgi:hypothetical protein
VRDLERAAVQLERPRRGERLRVDDLGEPGDRAAVDRAEEPGQPLGLAADDRGELGAVRLGGCVPEAELEEVAAVARVKEAAAARRRVLPPGRQRRKGPLQVVLEDAARVAELAEGGLRFVLF